jgi:glycosyltransferase involved in cell wall biosynthesis
VRVLQLFQPTDGGVARHVADIANELSERAGMHVALCGPRLPDAVAAQVQFYPLALTRSIQPLADMVAVKRLRHIVSLARPDLIHAHSSKAGAVARLLKLAGIQTPILYTPHGYAFAGYFDSPRKRSFYRRVEQALTPLTDCTVCVCRHEMELARSLAASNNTQLCYNGVPVPDAPPAHSTERISGQCPVIACLSLLRPGKGIEDLLDAVALLSEEFPNLALQIAGDGTTIDELRRMAERLRIADAVEFLGHVEEPARILAAADIFVLPSWAESLPYALLEAMALAMPIVATDVGGVSEAIVHERSGLLVPPRNRTRLAESIGLVLRDPRLASELGKEAHRIAAKQFTIERMVGRMAELYGLTLERRP